MDLSNPTLAITYKDDGNQDGICSQLLRIYGIYAISRFLGIPYFHSPIAHLGYHGLTALEDNSPSPDLLAAVNRVFHIPSDIELSDKRVMVHDMVDADVESIERIKNTGKNDPGVVHLIRILYPFPVTDTNPELYRSLKAICPFPYRRSEVFRLAIHVRRGELFAVSSDWMLPNAYYVSCTLRFQETLRRLGIPFVCELYTEAPTRRFEVTPEHHGISGRIREKLSFDPAMNHLEEFDGIPNLERFINLDPIESLRRMTTADALITSHSSFSYLPAIFNPNCIVVYHPYWRGRMKDWLISDDKGVFPERDLIERLKEWKWAADCDSAAALPGAAEAPPRDLQSQIDGLLQPFREQAATIRCVVAMGCHHQMSGTTNETTALRFVLTENGVPPGIRVEPIEPVADTLDRLAQQTGGRAGSSPGDDLLLVPAHLLNAQMTPPDEEFPFRALAAVLPASSCSGDQHTWRLRRSLFDRGLICIGAVDFGDGQALCFVASDAVRSFNRLDIESRGHVTMTTFLDGAGFANQLWRYACVKLYALRHGLTPALPAWQGNQLFGLEDPSCAGLNFPRISYPGFADDDRELWDQDDPPINVDLAGYFQEIPECWRNHRALLRRMFQLSPEHMQAIDAWRAAVTDGGRRTLVAISVRRGDYYKFQTPNLPWFRIVPEEWYLDWLRTIWPTLRDPVLFVASDEPDRVVPVFHEFEPIPASFPGIAAELPHHVSDFEVLRRADYLAICNSSFPRLAAILASSSQQCFLPSFETQSFVPYQPWIDPAFWRRFANTWSRINLGAEPERSAPAVSIEPATLLVEVSDLLRSLSDQTRLSGVQRIQREIVRNVLESSPPEPVRFTVLSKVGEPRAIEAEALLDIIEQAGAGVKSRADLEPEVRALLTRAVPCTVRSNDIFLVTGEFWNVSGMWAMLRSVKNSGATAGVFLQDITPIAAPEYYEPDLTRRFVRGVAESLNFADFVLTASEYSKASLTRHLGSAVGSLPIGVVPLGQECSLPPSVGLEISAAVAEILETEYVLCAGTIEARRNPAYLFNLWKVMARSGRPNIPRLVFAGRKGGLVEDLLRQFEACNYLDGRILLVHDATDAELDALFRNCMLTVAPSFVEESGWPVSESLAHGKICLCSGEGGVAEAGGELLDYVDPYNVRDGLQRLLRYLDDHEYRRKRESEIAGHFRPRSWRQAADDLLTATRTLARQAPPFHGVSAVLVPPGQYVPISSEAPPILVDKTAGTTRMEGGRSPELMCVSGWYPPEISGVRASQPTAKLRFRLDAPVGTRINLVLRLAAIGRDFRIRINSGSGAEKEVSLAAGSNRVAVLAAMVEPGSLVTTHLHTMGGAVDGDEFPGGPYWMLQGILYFDPKDATSVIGRP